MKNTYNINKLKLRLAGLRDTKRLIIKTIRQSVALMKDIDKWGEESQRIYLICIFFEENMRRIRDVEGQIKSAENVGKTG